MIGASVELDMTPAEGLAKGGLRKATRIGINRAASPVKASVVSHAEAVKRYGFLAKSIRIRLRSYPADRFVAVIGPSHEVHPDQGKCSPAGKKGEPRKCRPSKYAHLVEKGTKRSAAAAVAEAGLRRDRPAVPENGRGRGRPGDRTGTGPPAT
jgi:hypothetical protein